jgi:predicted MFS family arabinose efflux permease
MDWSSRSATGSAPVSAPQLEQYSPDRWYVLGLLTLVYAVNIADRFSISTLIEPIKTELELTDASVAFLTGVALAIFYVTIGIPVAALADRANRRNVIACAVALWSVMTTFCGLAQTYWHLLLARIGVGIGEAGGTAPSTSMLADKFPPARRPMALTLFALGASLGSWLGSSIAGGISDRFGWRAAFLALGIPGTVLALTVFMTVREPKRGALDVTAFSVAPMSFKETLQHIARSRSALHLLIAATVVTFWSWGLMWWTPTFLVRSYEMTVGQAGATLGSMHLFAGSACTVLTSLLMARPAAADPRHVARLLAGVTAITTIPSLVLYWTLSRDLSLAMLWIFVPAIYFYIGPILGVLQNLVPPGGRAQACAILLLMANVANLVIAPQLIGILSDYLAATADTGRESLRFALLAMAPTGFWAAWHLWTCGRTIREDQARTGSSAPFAATRIPQP